MQEGDVRTASDTETEEPTGKGVDLVLELPIGYVRTLKDEGWALGMTHCHLIQ
jgi:hypothetical protein